MHFNEALKLFRFPSIPTRSDLLTRYRELVKQTHPDMHPNIDPAKFREVQEAYEELKDSALEDVQAGYGMRIKIDPNLGRGLGPYGTPCPTCKGNGSIIVSSILNDLCRDCMGVGFYNIEIKCKRCNGMGKYAPSSPTPCHVCGGSGLYRVKKVKCSPCTGTGVLHTTQHIRSETCWNCKGVGEKEMFNPVFPKGRL